jgi:hypothetical protein
MFNDGQYWERLKNGQFRKRFLKDSHPTPLGAGEPFCTRNQIVSYLDPDGSEVARVHQYLRRDGTLGASGRPDPKKLRDGDVIYTADGPE